MTLGCLGLVSLLRFRPTSFLYSNSPLPGFVRFHPFPLPFLFTWHFTAVLISVTVTTLSSSSIVSASSAALLVSLSAISLPAISAWPGVQSMFRLSPFFRSSSIGFFTWLIVPWYDAGVRPRVRSPATDWLSEKVSLLRIVFFPSLSRWIQALSKLPPALPGE